MLPALDAGGVERGTLEVGRYLAGHGHRSLVMSGGGRMVGQLEREGSEHFTWPVGSKSPWTLRLVWKLRRFLIEQKVDILHVRSRMPAWLAWLAWKGMDSAARPRFVSTVHGLYSVNWYSAVMMRGERVIAVSETVRRYIRQNYPAVAPERIVVIPRGVDAAEFSGSFRPSEAWLMTWRAQYPQLEGKQVLTLPGRLTRLKGHEDFIELMGRLKTRGLAAHGLIVGGEDPKRRRYAEELRRKVAVAGLADSVTFTGHRNDLREIMTVSDIVLSLSSRPEAFGRTALEALSLGVPVVGYDHGGVGEILTGMFPRGLVKLHDRHALVEKVAELLSEHAMVEPARHFPLSGMLDGTMAVYCEFFLKG